MKIKDIEKVSSLYKALVNLDNEIISIEKFAMYTAKESLKTRIAIVCENVSPKKDDEKKDIFDQHGFIKPDYLSGISPMQENIEVIDLGGMIEARFRGMWVGQQKEKPKSKPDMELRLDISEPTLLRILESLLFDKKKERRELINQLNAYGIKL